MQLATQWQPMDAQSAANKYDYCVLFIWEFTQQCSPFQHKSITLDFFFFLSWETGAYAEIYNLGHTSLAKLAQLSTAFQFVQQLVITYTVQYMFPLRSHKFPLDSAVLHISARHLIFHSCL